MATANIASIVVVASSRAVISGRLTSATVVISRMTGKVTAVFNSVIPASEFPTGTPYTDYSPQVLLPGLVDPHVHFNEPGRTEWEGFYTGTQAAASGGVTTVIDMPLNAIPPTTTVAGLKEKIQAAKGKCWVDVGFYAGIIPGNTQELKALVQEGVRGFKGFLMHSGVDEFPAVSSADIEKAMVELADQPTMLMFHAEMVPLISGSMADNVQQSKAPAIPDTPLEAYSTFLASRPVFFETSAIKCILSMTHFAPNLPLHIVHLSAMESIPLLREARTQGVKITAETSFHSLSLTAEEVCDGDTRFKCCPPIRSRLNKQGLWAELEKHTRDGVIKTVVSDHSPCTLALKLLPSHLPGACSTGKPEDHGNFFLAWGGISSIGLGLSIFWTELSRRKCLSTSHTNEIIKNALQDIARLCCANTATQVGLQSQKGDLAVGFDADICVFDDSAQWVVEPRTMLFRNKCSPYEGRVLRGMVRETWLRGERVFSHDQGFDSKIPAGKLLLEKRV